MKETFESLVTWKKVGRTGVVVGSGFALSRLLLLDPSEQIFTVCNSILLIGGCICLILDQVTEEYYAGGGKDNWPK